MKVSSCLAFWTCFLNIPLLGIQKILWSKKSFKPLAQFAAIKSVSNAAERQKKEDDIFHYILINNNKLQWSMLKRIYSTTSYDVGNRLKKGKYGLQESAGLKSSNTQKKKLERIF